MIGDNILRIRKQRGLTLSELAEKALISKSYLSNIERNLNKNPSIHVIEKIAAVLHVDIQKIIYPTTENGKFNTSNEEELISLIQELKGVGIDKDNVDDYKMLIEFIKWRQGNKGIK